MVVYVHRREAEERRQQEEAERKAAEEAEKQRRLEEGEEEEGEGTLTVIGTEACSHPSDISLFVTHAQLHLPCGAH